eukprot:6213787-Pleurochrysis_carterae.AAC.7
MRRGRGMSAWPVNAIYVSEPQRPLCGHSHGAEDQTSQLRARFSSVAFAQEVMSEMEKKLKDLAHPACHRYPSSHGFQGPCPSPSYNFWEALTASTCAFYVFARLASRRAVRQRFTRVRIFHSFSRAFPFALPPHQQVVWRQADGGARRHIRSALALSQGAAARAQGQRARVTPVGVLAAALPFANCLTLRPCAFPRCSLPVRSSLRSAFCVASVVVTLRFTKLEFNGSVRCEHYHLRCKCGGCA